MSVPSSPSPSTSESVIDLDPDQHGPSPMDQSEVTMPPPPTSPSGGQLSQTPMVSSVLHLPPQSGKSHSSTLTQDGSLREASPFGFAEGSCSSSSQQTELGLQLTQNLNINWGTKIDWKTVTKASSTTTKKPVEELGTHGIISLHPRRWHCSEKEANYRRILSPQAMEFKSLMLSLAKSGWEISKLFLFFFEFYSFRLILFFKEFLGTFVYAQNEQGEYLLNKYGEYMICAVDGQHRCAVQVNNDLFFLFDP